MVGKALEPTSPKQVVFLLTLALLLDRPQAANFGHTGDRAALSKAVVPPDCAVPTHSLQERSERTDGAIVLLLPIRG
jgi:hypothetical protein